MWNGSGILSSSSHFLKMRTFSLRNVVKAFYTSGHIFDVLGLFGELDEQIAAHRKYAKWKAAYIHNCLKSGETPVPGPPPSEDDDGFQGYCPIGQGKFKNFSWLAAKPRIIADSKSACRFPKSVTTIL